MVKGGNRVTLGKAIQRQERPEKPDRDLNPFDTTNKLLEEMNIYGPTGTEGHPRKQIMLRMSQINMQYSK